MRFLLKTYQQCRVTWGGGTPDHPSSLPLLFLILLFLRTLPEVLAPNCVWCHLLRLANLSVRKPSTCRVDGLVGCGIALWRLECDRHISSTYTTDPPGVWQEARMIGPHTPTHSLTRTRHIIAVSRDVRARRCPKCVQRPSPRWHFSRCVGGLFRARSAAAFGGCPPGATQNVLLKKRLIVVKATRP